MAKSDQFGGQTYDFLQGVNFGRFWDFGDFGENFDDLKKLEEC